MLLAEWRFAQRLRIEPVYMLMRMWGKEDFPPMHELFSIVDPPDEGGIDDPFYNPDDDVLFSQVALVLGAK